MPRPRSPSDKYIRKRPYTSPSGSNMKRSMPPLPRQMRSSSRSPLRRIRNFPSQRPGASRRGRPMDDGGRMSGRSYNRNSRPSMKRSRSPVPRRHSLSPREKRSPMKKSPSASRKSPMGSKRRSVSPMHQNSPRRMDDSCHRQASHAINTGSLKRDYEPMKSGRRSLSPVSRKKDQQTSSLQRHEDHMLGNSRAKDIDKYRSGAREGNRFIMTDQNRYDYMDYRSSDQRGDRPINSGSTQYHGNRDDRYPVKDVNPDRSLTPFRNEQRGDNKRYKDGTYDNLYYSDDIYRKQSSDTGPEYAAREGGSLLDDSFRDLDGLRPYSSEELKKITVDIRRNIPREGDSILRRIVNPESVLVVRRTDEGVRPIFDRDEIKQGMMERSDEFGEKRVVAIVPGRSRSLSPDSRVPPYSEHGTSFHENFKIHREKYTTYDQDNYQERPRLSDRWQQDSRDRKFGSSQNEKLLVSVRSRSPKMHHDGYRSPDSDRYRDGSRHNSYQDSEFRGSKYYRGGEDNHQDFDLQRRPLPTNPNDLRHSLLSRGRPFDVIDARQRILERRERDREPSHGHRFEMRDYDLAGESNSRFSDDRGKGGFNPFWERERYRGDDGNGKLPNFAARPDRYQYKEWIDKPDMVPKGPSYFEHDNRDGEIDYSRRGRGRGIRGFVRGRGFRGRGTDVFRGRGRGMYMMNRRGKRSPNQWEHDMFEKMSPDGNMDSDG